MATTVVAAASPRVAAVAMSVVSATTVAKAVATPIPMAAAQVVASVRLMAIAMAMISATWALQIIVWGVTALRSKLSETLFNKVHL